MTYRVTLIASLLASLIALPVQAESPSLQRANKLLASTPLIDGHNDLPYIIASYGKPHHDIDAYDLNHAMPHETDIARMRKGHLTGQFWAVYVPGELKSGWMKVGMEQLELTRRMIAKYPEALQPAYSANDIERAFRQKRVASLLGLEGGHMIENSLGALRAYYMLGARYLTLTHNVTLDWADAALDEPKHKGLTPFGKEVVREMNRLGMLVDLSHVSADVMRDAIATSEAPVIFSHSSARAVTDHPRNVPDDVLASVPKNGGVVMITYVPAFVSTEAMNWVKGLLAAKAAAGSDSEAVKAAQAAYIAAHGKAPQATLKQVADHIDHVAKVAGKDHVGLAADYGGATVPPMPKGLEDVSTYPNLFAELMDRGWSDADLKKLAGLNLIRTFREAEKVAARLQKTRAPSIATIEELDGRMTQAAE
ncbi:dipeptidase [Massilia endophytica]|uniref:dipeptidase n=1 Tax=Massilia endophytica TaxID=2899220 RepID=UPI001E472A30|nr:dipeptidase [Massilia endophytica]UGQ45878.1 dipeptidase [Massilia endophytica]